MNGGWGSKQKPDATSSKGRGSTFFSFPSVCTSASIKHFFGKKKEKYFTYYIALIM